jgi:hypothetical protein
VWDDYSPSTDTQLIVSNRSGTELSPLFEPFSYNFDSYAGTLENFGLPYSFGIPDADAPLQEFNEPPPAAINESQEQLSVNVIACNCTVRDNEGNDIWISANAQLNGNFFVADVEDMVRGGPSQLTCYRRNIFGVSGFISFPSTPGRIMDANGEEAAISRVEVCVSAFDSTQRKETELVHLPLKAIGSDIQIIEERTQIMPLFSETPPREDRKSGFTATTFPFEWKRLQFRKATANSECHQPTPILHFCIC